MSVDWFFKLKEIDSLTKMKSAFLKNKSEQEDRVSKLRERRESSLMQITSLQQEVFSTNHKLSEAEKKLKTASEQKQRLMDIGGDENKISLFQTEIDHAEEQGLELLTLLDSLETQMTEIKTFLSGLEKSLQEIESEVQPEVAKINSELINIDLRLKLLIEELPDSFRTTYLKTAARNLAHGPFTRVDQGNCFFCRYKISRIEESEIDMQRNLKSCPQCYRIFLPYGA